jgi:23S rRNA pseudouridine2605 synthase
LFAKTGHGVHSGWPSYVNGQRAKDVSIRVSIEIDRIALDGIETRPDREPIVIGLHKPAGYVTTRHDPQGRPTVYSLLPALDRFVFPVGRLDKDTSGLLILTDDHRLGETLTNPHSGIPKTYDLLLDRPPDERQLDSLRKGIGIGKGEFTRPAWIETAVTDSPGAAIRITINEGKNRQVRRMVSAIGLSLLSLSRTSIGGFPLGDLAVGESRRLSWQDRLLLVKTPPQSSR